MGKTGASEPPVLELKSTALFLDYDGTLVPIAPTPAAAVADEPLRRLLDRLDRAVDGAFALVSGRPVADIDGFLAPLRLTVAGLHGLDLRLSDGSRHEAAGPEDALTRARAALAELHGRTPGTLLEDKRLTVAFHYRGAPSVGPEALALAERLVEASGGALQLLPGKMVVELLPAGRDKGSAIGQLMELSEFAGRRPVFVGDDVTDETGFRVVNGRGGVSIRVGTTERDSEALFQLADVQALRTWLAAALDLAEGR